MSWKLIQGRDTFPIADSTLRKVVYAVMERQVTLFTLGRLSQEGVTEDMLNRVIRCLEEQSTVRSENAQPEQDEVVLLAKVMRTEIDEVYSSLASNTACLRQEIKEQRDKASRLEDELEQCKEANKKLGLAQQELDDRLSKQISYHLGSYRTQETSVRSFESPRRLAQYTPSPAKKRARVEIEDYRLVFFLKDEASHAIIEKYERIVPSLPITLSQLIFYIRSRYTSAPKDIEVYYMYNGDLVVINSDDDVVKAIATTQDFVVFKKEV